MTRAATTTRQFTRWRLAALLLAMMLIVLLYYLPAVSNVPETLASITSSLVDFNALKIYAHSLSAYVEQAPVLSAGLFALIYFSVCAVPFPFVSVPTILAGYLFGLWQGLLLASFASALGSCALFSVCRRYLVVWIKRRFSKRLELLKLSESVDDITVAISLRLIPGMPFFLPSVLLSFTKISLPKFYLSTQLGLLLMVFIYVNAGSSLATIRATDDIFSPQLIASMTLLALLPLAYKWRSFARVKPAAE